MGIGAIIIMLLTGGAAAATLYATHPYTRELFNGWGLGPILSGIGNMFSGWGSSASPSTGIDQAKANLAAAQKDAENVKDPAQQPAADAAVQKAAAELQARQEALPGQIEDGLEDMMTSMKENAAAIRSAIPHTRALSAKKEQWSRKMDAGITRLNRLEHMYREQKERGLSKEAVQEIIDELIDIHNDTKLSMIKTGAIGQNFGKTRDGEKTKDLESEQLKALRELRHKAKDLPSRGEGHSSDSFDTGNPSRERGRSEALQRSGLLDEDATQRSLAKRQKDLHSIQDQETHIGNDIEALEKQNNKKEEEISKNKKKLEEDLTAEDRKIAAESDPAKKEELIKNKEELIQKHDRQQKKIKEQIVENQQSIDILKLRNNANNQEIKDTERSLRRLGSALGGGANGYPEKTNEDLAREQRIAERAAANVRIVNMQPITKEVALRYNQLLGQRETLNREVNTPSPYDDLTPLSQSVGAQLINVNIELKAMQEKYGINADFRPITAPPPEEQKEQEALQAQRKAQEQAKSSQDNINKINATLRLNDTQLEAVLQLQAILKKNRAIDSSSYSTSAEKQTEQEPLKADWNRVRDKAFPRGITDQQLEVYRLQIASINNVFMNGPQIRGILETKRSVEESKIQEVSGSGAVSKLREREASRSAP